MQKTICGRCKLPVDPTRRGVPRANVVAVPATATSAGIAGQIALDREYVYLCVATNDWLRAPQAEFHGFRKEREFRGFITKNGERVAL
jgi:hypothetical protein